MDKNTTLYGAYLEMSKTCASEFTPTQKQKLESLETTIHISYISTYLTTIETYATTKKLRSPEASEEYEKHNEKVEQPRTSLESEIIEGFRMPPLPEPSIAYDSFAMFMQPVLIETTAATPAIDPKKLMQLLEIKTVAMLNIASRPKFIIERYPQLIP